MCEIVTAGDLIRRSLAGGATELGLAKEIAGQANDQHPDVQRLRFVIMRAADGGEPNARNAKEIAEFYGVEVDRPSRVRQNGHPQRLEVVVLRLVEDVDNLTGQVEHLEQQVERLDERVAILERRSPPESPAGETGGNP